MEGLRYNVVFVYTYFLNLLKHNVVTYFINLMKHNFKNQELKWEMSDSWMTKFESKSSNKRKGLMPIDQ